MPEQGEMKVKAQNCRSFFSRRWALPLAALLLVSGTAGADVSGLNAEALAELRAAGVDKYLGTSESTRSEHGVWTKHAFNPRYASDAGYGSGVRADGPVCIAGTPYSVFTREGTGSSKPLDPSGLTWPT